MINHRLVTGRLVMITDFLSQMEALSKLSKSDFLHDRRNAAAVESYLRRTLEAIFDIGRHILAKTGYMDLASEYKSIAKGLGKNSVIHEGLSETLVMMAGYRNRLVHMYHVVTEEELYHVINHHLDDLKQFITEIKIFMKGSK